MRVFVGEAFWSLVDFGLRGVEGVVFGLRRVAFDRKCRGRREIVRRRRDREDA